MIVGRVFLLIAATRTLKNNMRENKKEMSGGPTNVRRLNQLTPIRSPGPITQI